MKWIFSMFYANDTRSQIKLHFCITVLFTLIIFYRKKTDQDIEHEPTHDITNIQHYSYRIGLVKIQLLSLFTVSFSFTTRIKLLRTEDVDMQKKRKEKKKDKVLKKEKKYSGQGKNGVINSTFINQVDSFLACFKGRCSSDIAPGEDIFPSQIFFLRKEPFLRCSSLLSSYYFLKECFATRYCDKLTILLKNAFSYIILHTERNNDGDDVYSASRDVYDPKDSGQGEQMVLCHCFG